MLKAEGPRVGLATGAGAKAGVFPSCLRTPREVMASPRVLCAIPLLPNLEMPGPGPLGSAGLHGCSACLVRAARGVR